MRILTVHNAYQQRGGEDAVVEAEAALLTKRGHDVLHIRRHNREIQSIQKAIVAAETIWSIKSARLVARTVADTCPDVVHIHNTFPLVSPAAIWQVAAAGIPIVHTLHNFRLLCPQALFLRDGRPCEDCLGRIPWRGAVRGCYRESRSQSAVVATMLVVHRLIGTWKHKVDRFIALSAFAKSKLVEGGLPAERIVIKPNCVSAAPPAAQARFGFLFVGRLSHEKGIRLLRDTAATLGEGELRVVGDGPESQLLEGMPAITTLGRLANTLVREEMERATSLVVPSICYETCPLVVFEAFAAGLPVIAARHGAIPEFVTEGVCGLLFDPGNAADLATKLAWARANPEAMAEMGRRARARYEANYTPERNYDRLMEIYRNAIEDSRRGR